MFIGKYDKSVVVTFLGTLSAMIGMYFVLGYEEPRLTGAIICLVIAIIGICIRYIKTLTQKLLVEKTFKRYVAPEVVDKIMKTGMDNIVDKAADVAPKVIPPVV